MWAAAGGIAAPASPSHAPPARGRWALSAVVSLVASTVAERLGAGSAPPVVAWCSTGLQRRRVFVPVSSRAGPCSGPHSRARSRTLRVHLVAAGGSESQNSGRRANHGRSLRSLARLPAGGRDALSGMATMAAASQAVAEPRIARDAWAIRRIRAQHGPLPGRLDRSQGCSSANEATLRQAIARDTPGAPPPSAPRRLELCALASELFQKPVDVTAQGDD